MNNRAVLDYSDRSIWVLLREALRQQHVVPGKLMGLGSLWKIIYHIRFCCNVTNYRFSHLIHLIQPQCSHTVLILQYFQLLDVSQVFRFKDQIVSLRHTLNPTDATESVCVKTLTLCRRARSCSREQQLPLPGGLCSAASWWPSRRGDQTPASPGRLRRSWLKRN